MSARRLKDRIHFYSILNQFKKAICAARALADCRGRMKWPSRGVYFFHETGENRSDMGEGPRGAAGRNACAENRRKHDALGRLANAST